MRALNLAVSFCLLGLIGVAPRAQAMPLDVAQRQLAFLNGVVEAVLVEKHLDQIHGSVTLPSLFTSPYQLYGVGVHLAARALEAAGVDFGMKHRALTPREVNYEYRDEKGSIWLASCSLQIDTTNEAPHRRFFVMSHSCSPIFITRKTPGFAEVTANFAAVVTVDDAGAPVSVQLLEKFEGVEISTLLK